MSHNTLSTYSLIKYKLKSNHLKQFAYYEMYRKITDILENLGVNENREIRNVSNE